MQPTALIEIDFRRLGKALVRRIGLLLVVLLLGGVAGGAFGYLTTSKHDLYDAHASVFSQSSSAYGMAPDTVQYANVAKSLKVAQRATLLLGEDDLDASTISSMVQVEYQDTPYQTNSAVLEIHAEGIDPDQTVRVANAVAEAFVAEVAGLTGNDNVKMLDKAVAATQSFDAGQQVITLAGMGAGGCLLVAVGLILLMEIFSFRLHTVRDGTLNGQLPLLGVVPQYNNTPPSPPQPKARAARRG